MANWTWRTHQRTAARGGADISMHQLHIEHPAICTSCSGCRRTAPQRAPDPACSASGAGVEAARVGARGDLWH